MPLHRRRRAAWAQRIRRGTRQRSRPAGKTKMLLKGACRNPCKRRAGSGTAPIAKPMREFVQITRQTCLSDMDSRQICLYSQVMVKDRSAGSARERLLAAADVLFYEEG